MKNQEIEEPSNLADQIRFQAKEDFNNGLPIESYHKHGLRGGQAKLYKAVWNHEQNPLRPQLPPLTEKPSEPEATIKCCPFCGSDAILTQQTDRKSGMFYFVICTDMKCGCGLRPRRNPRAAIAQWNVR